MSGNPDLNSTQSLEEFGDNIIKLFNACKQMSGPQLRAMYYAPIVYAVKARGADDSKAMRIAMDMEAMLTTKMDEEFGGSGSGHVDVDQVSQT